VKDGAYVVVNGECPTCALIRPLLGSLPVTVLDEDVDDGLAASWRLGVDNVPTLLRVCDGDVTDRLVGWSRPAWCAFFGLSSLGDGLPDYRPGCGARAVDPAYVSRVLPFASRRVALADGEDEMEAMFARGWTDGLPVVPRTPERVARMLAGTGRSPSEVVAVVPPDLVECTVEKVAVNAVLAGCLPEHLPVVLACVEAACTPAFNAHGLLATTYFSGPVVIVNGPVARAIGMNSGVNAFGQGNRANACIGRALQLVIRNVGGGRPGEVDRATLGNPGKYTFCFAEDEAGSPWEPLSEWRGFAPGVSTVTLFAGEGPRGVVDQLSRQPESLARSFASASRSVAHPKLVLGFDAVLVVSPEHARVFRSAGWTRDRLLAELSSLLLLPGAELVRGAGGIAEGVPVGFEGASLPKFREGGLLIVHAGGGAGMFSAVIGGWVNGETGSQPVTREVAW